MKKMVIKKELICPFNKCRIPYGHDKEGNEVYKEMGINCENCGYVWNRKSTVIVEEGCVLLDENSKEYKEYEILHKVTVVENEE